MNKIDLAYRKYLFEILANGEKIDDRTGVGAITTFGTVLEHDCQDGLAQIQVRSSAPRIAFEELMWMLKGQTDVGILQDKNIHIWDGNTTREALDSYGKTHIETNSIGRGYSYQFRNFGGVDQLKTVIEGIKNNPTSRRHVINLWNPAELKDMALEPCHLMYNFVFANNKLHLMQYKRSDDAVLGQPTNIMFANFFLGLVCAYTKIPMGKIKTVSANSHIYSNHVDAVHKMLAVDTLLLQNCPKIDWKITKEINSFDDILSVEWSDIEITKAKPILKFSKEDLPMAV
jgi:thymidylate synthase